jgi:hypothetical protein
LNCPKCQTPISADWAVCPKCGIQLNQLPMGIAVTEVKRPSRWQYFAGIAIIIITTVIAMALVVSSVMSLLKPDIHVAVPCGNQSVTLNRAGSYILFCEEQGVSNSSCDSISDMDINLYDSASNPVELSYPSSDIHYTINDKSYSSLFQFQIDAPGTYTIDAHYSAGKSGPNAVIAVGSFNFTGAFIAAFFIGTIGFIIGLTIIIRAAVKRRSIGRRAGVTPIDRFWC